MRKFNAYNAYAHVYGITLTLSLSLSISYTNDQVKMKWTANGGMAAV